MMTSGLNSVSGKVFPMVMAVVLLLAIAILLAFYSKFDLRKFAESRIKPLLTKTDQLNKFATDSEASIITDNDYYHARQIRPKGVWDIPGPIALPMLGTKWIFMLFFRKYKMSKLHEVYADLNTRHGDIVLEVMPSGVPIVHLFNRHDLEKVLKYPSKYPFRPPTEIVVTYRSSRPERYASVGIVNEQGPTWQKLRSSLTSYITSPRILQNFLPSLNLVCDDFIDLLKEHRNPHTSEVTNFEDIANLMGLEAVCTLMLGRRMGFLSTNAEKPEKIRQLAAAVKQLFISQRDSYYGFGLWKYFPTRTYRQFARAEETIYDVISEMVDKAMEDNNANFVHQDDDMRSVFQHILELKDLDIRDKKSAIIDFIAAGIETLANTLLFVLSSVTGNAEVVSKILNEFQEHRHTLILQDAFTNAIFTKACIQESYRVRPTAFCLARILEEDMQLSGYDLKAGTVVLCQNMIACHKDNNFPEAKTFHPERWLDSEGNFSVNIESSTIVVPFGIGKRTCPGKRFVEMEIVLLLAKTVVLCQNMIACHKDNNFPEAKTFHPERWLDSEGNFSVNIESSTIVVPFGIGKRTCPGKRFVEMEIVLLLAKLLLEFDISFVNPLETEFEFLLAPKTPLRLVMRDRVY